MKRRIIVPALAVIACVVIFPVALWAQDSERSYSPEGAWLGSATMPFSSTPFPFMDLYTADSNSSARAGTVLCTQPHGRSWSQPLGIFVTATQSAHGTWSRIEKNKFAFTALRILLNAETSEAVGFVKFWGTIELQTNDSFTGVMNIAYYDSNWTLLMRFAGTTTAMRMAVEMPEP